GRTPGSLPIAAKRLEGFHRWRWRYTSQDFSNGDVGFQTNQVPLSIPCITDAVPLNTEPRSGSDRVQGALLHLQRRAIQSTLTLTLGSLLSRLTMPSFLLKHAQENYNWLTLTASSLKVLFRLVTSLHFALME